MSVLSLLHSIVKFQDRAAKFVDKLSAIGGTMGLLTGFSIISGVEILYFLVKIILRIRNKTTLKIRELKYKQTGF